MVIGAVAVRLVCATAIAVMVTTLFGVGTVAGAVYVDVALELLGFIVPTVEFPPATVLTSQFASVLLRPLIVAVQRDVPNTTTVVDAQETVMVGLDVVEELGLLPQEVKTAGAAASAMDTTMRFQSGLPHPKRKFRPSTRNPPAFPTPIFLGMVRMPAAACFSHTLIRRRGSFCQ